MSNSMSIIPFKGIDLVSISDVQGILTNPDQRLLKCTLTTEFRERLNNIMRVINNDGSVPEFGPRSFNYTTERSYGPLSDPRALPPKLSDRFVVFLDYMSEHLHEGDPEYGTAQTIESFLHESSEEELDRQLMNIPSMRDRIIQMVNEYVTGTLEALSGEAVRNPQLVGIEMVFVTKDLSTGAEETTIISWGPTVIESGSNVPLLD